MTTRQIISRISVLGLFCAALLPASVGHTANTSAIIGHQWPTATSPSNYQTCFLGSGNFMENFCTTNRLLVVPVTIPSFKTFALKTRFQGNGTATATTCRPIRWTDGGGSVLSNALSTTSSTPLTFTHTSLSIPSGNLSFECDVAPVSGANRGAVLWVDWN
jgi:hypothetical protein